VQAYAIQGQLIGLPGLGVCSKFLVETITKKMNDTPNTQLERLQKNVHMLPRRRFVICSSVNN
jgi:hypothetical protein